MSQHIPPHHFHNHLAAQQLPPSPTQYIHYPPPSQPPPLHPVHNHAIAPQDTTRQPLNSLPSPIARSPSLSQQHAHAQQQQHLQQHQKITGAPLTNGAAHPGPLVATGDWTKDLIHLAKTAELKKHALTLQLHTAHILSAHASLEQKSKTIQDIREQKNKLDSERARLLNSLREINEDRDKADLMEVSINKECEELRRKIEHLTDGEYSSAKRDVDRLRAELGQPPVPSLQATLEEKKSQYLFERRMNGTDTSMANVKRNGMESSAESNPTGKRPRGRPKGSKNRAKNVSTSEAPPASSS
ncbi:hypothetical protein AX14_008463 [Amanita brunnescens Koide BX004]|nr:hypothetical protein AX14_008463 [Amanita brunnescens Koide BX004]